MENQEMENNKSKMENNFLEDYNLVVDLKKKTKKIKREWNNKNDVFQKFTMLDYSYKSLPNIKFNGSKQLEDL